MLVVDVDQTAEHTYTEIVDALRRHGADAQTDIEELWRRIAFFILINNVDDQLHNHGFLHVAKGQWRLSRAWISDQAGPSASIDALMATASADAFEHPDRKAAQSIIGSTNRAAQG